MIFSLLTTFLKILAVLLCLSFLYLFVGWPKVYPKTYGVTWSVDYASHLGIDPYEGLRAALDELNIRHFRIPIYWTYIESKRGMYDWSSVDRQLDIIARRGGKVTLVVGAKQPRWPECWIPDWAKQVDSSVRRDAQLNYVRVAIERYRAREVVERWQVENEPSFFSSFGDCAFYDARLLTTEIDLVKKLDPSRPISTTASGELAWWLKEPRGIDLGVSTHRVVSNPRFSRFRYWFLPPWFYARRAAIREWIRGGQVYVSEFQMEPWVQGDMLTLSDEDMFRTFDLEQMKKNITYAERMNVPRVDFWGIEWWYWLKVERNQLEYWEEMKKVFLSNGDAGFFK